LRVPEENKILQAHTAHGAQRLAVCRAGVS